MGRPASPPEFVLPQTPCNVPIRRCGVAADAADKRILIMRLAAHGDILMGTPLLSALRDAFPDAHLTWLVGRNEHDAIDAHPLVDELILWDGGYWKNLVRRCLYLPWLIRALRMRAELRHRRYDVFISFQPEEWPLLVRGVGAPTSIGVFDTFRDFYRSRRSSPRTRLYTTAYTCTDLPPHRTDQYLLPLRALGLAEPADKRMSMGFTAEDEVAVDRFLRERDVRPDSRLVVLAPMTTWPSRCWPAERYVRLGIALTRHEGCRIVLIGSAKEREAVEQIAGEMRTEPVLAAGVLSFRQMAALLARAALVVTGDTGPMHVAAAVGAPYVALFGPTPVAGRAPLAGLGLSLAHPVPCGPCEQKHCPNTGENHRLCLRLISVEEVLEVSSKLLRTSLARP